MKKGILFLLIFSFFIGANAGALTVALNIVETGVPENRILTEYTGLWEDAFMDVFFESGYIISNDTILRLETKPSDSVFDLVVKDVNEIRSWGIDFILITQLDYIENIRQPSEIVFIIYNVRSDQIILERKIEGRTYRSTREGYDDIKLIVRGLIPFIR